MKSLLSSIELPKNPSNFLKSTFLTLLSLSFLYLFNHHFTDTNLNLTFFRQSPPTTSEPLNPPPTVHVRTSPPHAPPPPPPPPPPPAREIHHTGIVDENGTMLDDFDVDDNAVIIGEEEEERNVTVKIESGKEKIGEYRVRLKKFRVCDESMRDYIPCLDNVEKVKRLNSTEKGEIYERHCPEEGKGLDCLVPRPKRYRTPIQWPQSRDAVIVFLD